jgi:hypothetical protein
VCALLWSPWPICSKVLNQACSQRLARAKVYAHKSRKSTSTCKRSARRPHMVLRYPLTPQWPPHSRPSRDLLTRNNINSNNRLWDMQSTGIRCRRVQSNSKRLKTPLVHGPGRSNHKATHRITTTILKVSAVGRTGPDSGTQQRVAETTIFFNTPNSECCETFCFTLENHSLGVCLVGSDIYPHLATAVFFPRELFSFFYSLAL